MVGKKNMWWVEIKYVVFNVLARAAALQSVAVRRLTGNDVSGPLFSPLFIFFPFFFIFSVVTFSRRRSAQIKKII